MKEKVLKLVSVIKNKLQAVSISKKNALFMIAACMLACCVGFLIFNCNGCSTNPNTDTEETPGSKDDYNGYNVEQLHKKCIELSKNENDPNYIECKSKYIEKCKDGGIRIMSEQYAKHPDFSIIKNLVEEEVINKLDNYDFDHLVANAEFYIGSEYNSTIINYLEEVSFTRGPIARASVYRLNMDDSFESVIIDDFDDMEERTDLKTCRELVDCYKGTKLSNAVKEKFISRITWEFDKVSKDYLNNISDNLSGFDGTIKNDLEKAYKEMFEGLFDWNNIVNNATRGMDGARSVFNEKWEESINSKSYNIIIHEAINKATNTHEKAINSILKQIDMKGANINIDVSSIDFSANKEVRDNTIRAKTKSVIGDVVLRAIDLVTLPVGGKANFVVFAGTAALEFGADMLFDNPKEYFLSEQFVHIINKITEESGNCYKKIQEENNRIIKQIESEL